MLGFFKKILSPFSKWKSALGQKVRALFSRAPDENAYEELEQLFYEADLGPAIAAELVEKLRKRRPSADEVLPFLKAELLPFFPPAGEIALQSPHIILIVGVNGSGKTTTIAKLASRYRKEGKSVLIAAGDTFRAAAAEQLETWAKRVGVMIVKSQPNSDPSSVAFDALAAAKSRGADVVLIDTAGRLQTKTDLMQELSKVRRVIQKQIDAAPHETLLVVDATVGQNALDQAKTFNAHAKVTGIVLTKLDGTAKGGIAAAISKELKIPIRWVGTGEAEEDFAPFDASSYLDALLGLR